MNQKGLIPILIVIILATLVGGYLVYQNQTKPTPSPQPTTQPKTSPSPSDVTHESTTSGDTASWKTYTNTKYNFEFKYPAGFTTDDYPNYIPPYDLENLIILIRKQGFQLPNAQYMQAANFSISSSPNLPKCYFYRDNKITDKQTVNDAEYYVTQRSGAGAGNTIDGQIYRVIKNNVCIEVQSTITTRTGSGEGLVDLMPQIQQDEKNLQNEVDQILSTFRFD